METAGSYDTLVPTYQTTWRYIPEDCNLYIHRRENIKPHIAIDSAFFVTVSNGTAYLHLY
jgi:hypothetical protein